MKDKNQLESYASNKGRPILHHVQWSDADGTGGLYTWKSSKANALYHGLIAQGQKNVTIKYQNENGEWVDVIGSNKDGTNE